MIARGLRAIGAVLWAAAGLYRKQRAALDVVVGIIRLMNPARLRDEFEEWGMV